MLAGGVVIAAGFAVALVPLFPVPNGTIWIVVGTAALLVGAIRALTKR